MLSFWLLYHQYSWLTWYNKLQNRDIVLWSCNFFCFDGSPRKMVSWQFAVMREVYCVLIGIFHLKRLKMRTSDSWYNNYSSRNSMRVPYTHSNEKSVLYSEEVWGLLIDHEGHFNANTSSCQWFIILILMRLPRLMFSHPLSCPLPSVFIYILSTA